jgi:hypothetical protein
MSCATGSSALPAPSLTTEGVVRELHLQRAVLLCQSAHQLAFLIALTGELATLSAACAFSQPALTVGIFSGASDAATPSLLHSQRYAANHNVPHLQRGPHARSQRSPPIISPYAGKGFRARHKNRPGRIE